MFEGRIRKIALAVAALMSVPALAQDGSFFTQGNLVVAVEGCGVHGGTCTSVKNGTGDGSYNSSVGGYGHNQAAPFTLFQYTPNGTTSASFVNSLVLPENASGANFPAIGEYGSSSEGTLQLSGNGLYLTVMGYGVNTDLFNANPEAFGTDPSAMGALAQSGSLTGQTYIPVPRVVALIDANGKVNSSTPIYNIFNTNNPRSMYTLSGTTAYVSGQGTGKDSTGGVFYIPLYATDNAPTAITGLDATDNTIAQDTRTVQIYDNTLYVSTDSRAGSGNNRSFVGTLGSPPATSLYENGAGPTMLPGFGNTGGTGKVTITTGSNSNGNAFNAGLQINVSPMNYFFASPSVLYVADTGAGKQTSATSSVGDGGLQKWINSMPDGSGTWNLAYTLYQGLNLVVNTNTSGVSGLYGLTGRVSGNTVELYATSYVLNDLDLTYLYGITDNLSFTLASQASGESFTVLDTAPSDSNFKGVSLAPAPETSPSVSCTATPTSLWPPNGKPVPVTVSGTITPGTSLLAPNGISYAVIDSYGQDQPSGSFTTGPGGSYSFVVSLTASRNGNDKEGRTYTITVSAQDVFGNVGSCSSVVKVPHDQGH